MDKEIIKYKNIASTISVVLLLLAIPAIWPYGYYVFLRWLVTASALFLIWVAYNLKKTFWLFLMGIVAILFNPIIPVHLDKETWVIIDFIVAILFLISIFKIKLLESF
ncbi:hypothetical protein COX73_02995 [bacterium (Candidatus Gribaldobacteria) CG_4_10_14_0_2_um_filter_36_18]|uniref:Uncharacterized protein n=1 Tax=bacterium (Candidatus Gribaldobacteria) CG_4_10_14_0_2_um_filter_36_18 TaxID=2014264 RepID=A0A2M7VJK1_9BACT|nr:MAG: hypothetical protein COX73_02995 [bacterium (Candidatus Gribaldobacteria) CG_4_10_14_0_2_um_filter_36_18]